MCVFVFVVRGVILCGFVLVVCVCYFSCAVLLFWVFECFLFVFAPVVLVCVCLCVCVLEAPADPANCETVKKLNVFSLVLLLCAMFLLSVSFVLCVCL